ncbi:MAG: response regulator transcription factor [Pseudomonadota bacterium]|nr:response regulator transcription factor [Pseudomonadota bacterium]MDP1906226.1 response regulator transcription factor [Pseudomonadota bacterium]MDP2352315.1 response regulator transcription factor [Pseudomonadota bacterium]
MMATRVLITDDHPIVREGLSKILGTEPDMVVVGEAASGLEALSLLSRCRPNVVLVDISMPGMSGIELIGWIHAEAPQLPVLVLSMHKEEQFAVRALKLGAAGYLTKDCAPEQLAQAIRKVVAGGKYITTEVADALAAAVVPTHMAIPHELLSNREFQVFRMLASGQSVNEVAQALTLSPNTVSTHKSRLMRKLGVVNNAGLVRYAISHDLTQ